MSIQPTPPNVNIDPVLYHQLLTQVRTEFYRTMCRSELHRRGNQPTKPRSPEAEKALREYWGNLWKEEIAALDAEWAAQREPAPIIHTSEATENVVISKAS